jgi:ABC-type transport system involved in multi-copper enzyme maturation permease subunit
MNQRAGGRVGVGPVFVYEWITSTRRWHGYALRAVFLLLLLFSLVVAWRSYQPPRGTGPLGALAALGELFFVGAVGTQLTLVLLLAPAATAGAICLDRMRRTLTHVLVTDLSNAEIVLGKLAARLIPVVGLVACALPLMQILTLLGGVDPDALFGAFMVTVGVAFLGSSLALCFSLWARRTHEALLGTYAVLGLWLLCRPMAKMIGSVIPGFTWAPPPALDPFWLAFAPYWAPGAVDWGHYAWFLGVTAALSALLAGLVVLRIRAVCAREVVVKRKASLSRLVRRLQWLDPTRYLPAVSLDTNPVLWWECHRGRMSRGARAVYVLYLAIALTFSLLVGVIRFGTGVPWVSGLEVFAGILIVCVTASASLADERARGSLDVLLTTQLSTRQIVLGKWLGACRVLPVVAFLPAILTFGFIVERPDLWTPILLLIVFVLCAGAAITAFGLAVATWSSRPGWSVTVAVGVYGIVAIGWCFLPFMLVGGGAQAAGLAAASPFFGAADLGYHIAHGSLHEDRIGWGVLWIAGYALMTPAILAATVMHFDGLLGRIEGPFLRLVCGGFTRRERLVAVAFFVVATILALEGMFAGKEAYLLNPAIVTVGLLLAAIAGAISGARGLESGEIQRAALRGLSERRIALAKWVGAYRLVVPVVFLATLVVIGNWHPQRNEPLEICVMPAYLLAVGAAWCAIGVAMGMWFPCARAVMLTAAICGICNVIGPFVFSTIWSGWFGHVDWSGSPFVTVATMTLALAEWRFGSSPALVSANVWILVYMAVVVGLLAAAALGVQRRLAREPIDAALPAHRSALRSGLGQARA